MGVAAAIVVGLSVLAALTLLPAVLSIVGRRVDALGIPLFRTKEGNHESSAWFRLAGAIQRRPVWFAVGAMLLLGVFCIPFFSMQTSFGDASTNPPTSHTRRAYDLLAAGFGPGFNGPLTIVVDLRGAASDPLPPLTAALAQTPGIVRVADPVKNPAGDTAIIAAYPESSPQAAATNILVHHLRATVIPPAVAGTPVKAYVAGGTALTIDVADQISSRTPVFFAMVIGLSFLVLMCVFRSILIPLKAALMNVLSIGAAYGVLVVIFQWGWLESYTGIRQTGPIESFLPMMMFAIIFGLSMDYEVFLVSRIREEYIGGMPSSRAVGVGLASTARVITSAALIMIAVFSSFALGSERIIKEFGLGLATAVLLDATIVRLILVPSLMQLFGKANWWLPGPLDRYLPRVHLDAPVDVAPVSVEP
jgi:RND superfamily putative drug exporter